jgi:Fe-S cluster assembly ATPase SufC
LRRKGEVVLGKQKWIILPGSVRSTVQEIERLRADELARTGIEWEVCDA